MTVCGGVSLPLLVTVCGGGEPFGDSVGGEPSPFGDSVRGGGEPSPFGDSVRGGVSLPLLVTV